MKIKCKRIKIFDILSEEFLIIKLKFLKLIKLYRILLSKSRMIDSIANMLYESALSKRKKERKIRNISNDKFLK